MSKWPRPQRVLRLEGHSNLDAEAVLLESTSALEEVSFAHSRNRLLILNETTQLRKLDASYCSELLPSSVVLRQGRSQHLAVVRCSGSCSTPNSLWEKAHGPALASSLCFVRSLRSACRSDRQCALVSTYRVLRLASANLAASSRRDTHHEAALERWAHEMRWPRRCVCQARGTSGL